MTYLLGIDTGGTFTDAALLSTDESGGAKEVLAKSKSLTTRHDLAIGIGTAARSVIDDLGCDPAQIGLVSVSTTLATNALVEGQGGRVALIAIGFERRDLDNAGLSEALGDDPLVMLEGGHTTHGDEARPLDISTLEQQIDALAAEVTGFAVAGYFAVRNPDHEMQVREFILERTNRAVTCSHELSAKLNGPKRALTTVLNARLVPLITRLIEATQKTLDELGIAAPMMVVRGDGALVGSTFASGRPIETILSGPAASLVGAHFLTGADDAFVNDIGGTTSDVALLRNGRPQLDHQGARVGHYRTMVEAVAMHTFGLGGDSEVSTGGNPLRPTIMLGPKRLVPVSLLAEQFPTIVQGELDRQLKNQLPGRFDGRFAFRSGAGLAEGLSAGEQRLFDQLTTEPQALEGFLQGNSQAASLRRLVGKGLVMVAGLTPSDAIHVAEEYGAWSREAALKALELFGRRRDGSGKAIFADPVLLAREIVRRVRYRSAEIVLQTALQTQGRDAEALIQHEFVQDELERRSRNEPEDNLVSFAVDLKQPLIGLGASAHAYHPEAARLLNCEAIVPDHADVANAVGAVVGQISMQAQITVSQPAEGRFQVSGLEKIFTDEQMALKAAEESARENARRLAQQAGSNEVEITIKQDNKRAVIESRDMLIESIVVATATGRPPIVS